jgi:hypothetical protein
MSVAKFSTLRKVRQITFEQISHYNRLKTISRLSLSLSLSLSAQKSMTHSPRILTPVQRPLMEELFDTFSCFLIKHTSYQVSNSYVQISIVFLLQLSYIISVISYKNYWQKHREANRRTDVPVIINITAPFNLIKSKWCFLKEILQFFHFLLQLSGDGGVEDN